MRYFVIGAVVSFVLGGAAVAGPLTPPGAPAPTMKTLDQVDAGTPISTLPGGADAVHVITSSGRYYLDRDITNPGIGKHAIRVSASAVEIDFNGFSIRGDGSETLPAITLGPADTRIHGGSILNWGGSAIVETDAMLTLRDMTMRNIRGAELMSVNRRTLIEDCVFVGNAGPINLNGGSTGGTQGGIVIRGCVFEGMSEAISGPDTAGVQILDCLFSGLNSFSTPTKVIVGDDALISRCSFVRGGESAVIAGDGLRMVDCVAQGLGAGTGRPGIVARYNASISGCTVINYSGNGIEVLDRSIVRDCTISSNDGFGIDAANSAVITGNTLELNGSGIDAINGSRIVGNTIRDDSNSVGIHVGFDTFVGENSLDGPRIVVDGRHTVIDGNTFTDNDVAIELNNSDNVVRRNTFSAGAIGGSSGITGNRVYTIRTSVDYQSSGPFDNLQY